MKKIYLLIFLLIILLSGCKTRQLAVKPKNTGTPTTQILTTQNIVNQIDNANKEIRTLNISNAEALFTKDGKTQSVRISVRIIKDKEINISILPILGVEMFRIQLIPQRFYVFDKLNRRYCENSYNFLSDIAQTNITFETIQALLTNKLFSLTKEKNIAQAFVSQQVNDKFILASKEQVKEYSHIFQISPDYMIFSTSLNRFSNDLVSVNYLMFSLVDKVIFPLSMEVDANFPANRFNLKINVKKIAINQKLEINSIDFQRYTKVECTKMF